ncbi:hypothetical protein ACB092_11G010900 [Castanea dentata]
MRCSLRFSLSLSFESLLLSRLPHDASSRTNHPGSMGKSFSSFRTSKLCLAGNDEKLAVCKDRGANVCINYKMEDFVERVKEETVKLVENVFSLISKPHFSSTTDMIIILLSGQFHREVFVIVCYCQGI